MSNSHEIDEKTKKKSVKDLAMEFFKQHPNKEFRHGPVVDWIEEEYKKMYNKKPRDPWRAIRKLYQEGKLVKVKKGIYMYDPDLEKEKELFEFSPEIKKKIFERDNYRCVICGRGEKEGLEICADHIKPKDKGGDNSLENGQTLCSEHNLLKSNYSQLEMGKRFFIRIYEKAVKLNDNKMINFCKEIFNVYDKYNIDSQINRPDISN
ncbi:MAG: HNH endonuclease [Candidatus Helarchaeota archaeon]